MRILAEVTHFREHILGISFSISLAISNNQLSIRLSSHNSDMSISTFLCCVRIDLKQISHQYKSYVNQFAAGKMGLTG